MNLYYLFLNAKHKYGETIAIQDHYNHRNIRFSEIIETFHIIGHFLDLNNIASGTKVAILADANSEYLLLDYALMALGRVKVPLDNALSIQEIQAQLKDASATVLFYSENYAEIANQLTDSGLQCFPISSPYLQNKTEYLVPEIHPNTLLSLNYTGGSTGQPKAVMHSHQSMLNVISNIIIARNIKPQDRFLNVRPLWPIASVVVLAHILAGGTVILENRFQPNTFMSLLTQYKVAYTSLVPTQLARLLNTLQ
ncbi:MAG: class I adenylate-forming enzyme family protein, partial [Acinetobacter sp.]